MRRLVVFLGVALALAPAVLPSVAAAAPEIVDRVIAVVGNRIVLLSEVDEEVYLAQLRGQLDPKDPAAVAKYRQDVLDALVESQLLLEEARRDGIQVTREEVDEAVDGMVADVRSRFPDEASFEAQLEEEGTSLEALRKSYRGKLEDQLVVRQLVDRKVRSRVLVDEREVRRYWEEHQDDIPSLSSELTLRVIHVSLGSAALVDSAAVRRADLVRERAVKGEDFATLAKVFSEGPTAQRGGLLGWFAPQDLDPRLAGAISGQPAGTITPVILTDRGAHIVKIEDVNSDDGTMQLRQIVFLRDQDAARNQAKARAEAIRQRLLAGEDFAEVARETSDDPTSAEKGGELGTVPAESLEPKLREAIEPLQVGEITEVLEDPRGYSIFRLDGREGERDATFDDVHDRLVTLLEQQKSQEFYRQLVDEAREKTYVEYRLDGPES
ncbi:MAG: peptidylprolyl isomerase [Gemmatimonadetes bacterium]|nr:peptidylprolyl isomerase [Gemmatimonadota bacterium]